MTALSAVTATFTPPVISAQKPKQLDLIVFPPVGASYSLTFEVFKKKTQVTEADMKKPSYEWTAKSEPIKKPTIVHLNISPNATSFSCIFVPDKGQKVSSFFTAFNSSGIQLFQTKQLSDDFVNAVHHFSVAIARSKLPKDHNEQTIKIGDDFDSTSVSDAVEEKE